MQPAIRLQTGQHTPVVKSIIGDRMQFDQLKHREFQVPSSRCLLHLLTTGFGTELTKPELALCPQLAEADISPLGRNSGFTE